MPLDLTAKLKVPPHSVDAEQAVLGGLMLDNKAWDQIADKLVEKHFYRRDHQLIFRAMVKLMSENKPLDVITVSEVLQQLEMHDEVGGLAYLGELAKNTPSAANIGAYAEIVYERAILRELISVGTLITESAFDPQGRASLEILDEAEKKVFDISEQGSRGSGPEGIRGIVSKAIDNIEKRFHDNNPVTGIATGFADFDRLTTGMQEGDLVIVAGRPSMGKTLLGMNIAEHAAIRSQKAVLVFSMEMPGESLAMRMLSSIGRIDQNKLRTGRLVEEDWTRLTSAVSLLSNAKLYIDETPALTPMEMRTRARRVARERDGLGLIVVDYLQLMRGSSTTDNRTAEISEISRSLKQLAKELRVPVVALSQLNRSLEQRPNKRPVMSDLRESGAIEQDADLIVFIYRDEVYNEDSPDKGTAEIIIGKQRNGPIGTVRLTFMGQYARFENFTTDNMMAAIEA
ncbi:replicative DNA helicase [Candidatus Berkiella aquae]|uniref:Replicative DNA helicase n=1 Tax=Candidatus Berkiella aquae TaxID=295108 RepID=A0AAE3HT57_9GAMM|nr:replicative DNA helicase [Candidatus Berkiella aquae]